MTERDDILKAIASLEAQRTSLGDAAVEAALEGLRRKLAELDSPQETLLQRPKEFQWTSERRLVTVLFADISGFTARSEKMDPEMIRSQVNACFKHLVPVIQKYGGVVEKFIGDEIMAIFGAPVAHEDDAERCLHAALELMDALAIFNRENQLDFSIHIGANTGLVVAGGIGTPEQQQYGVTGDAVNLASRLAKLAQGGQIFVGPNTYRLTTPLFEFDALKPVSVKGKADSVLIYHVLGARAKPEKLRGLKSKGLFSPLVGREAEAAMIKACIGKLASGEGGIIGIIGEAGLGKSRLIQEIRNGLSNDREKFYWLESYTLSFGQSISYWPFQGILLEWAGISEEDDEPAAWAKLESSIQGLFGEQTLETLPYLASLLGIEVKDEYARRVAYLDSEGMGKQILLSMRRFFERLSALQPVILVFEDLHWMDHSSAVLLERLLPLTETTRLLIIGLSRPERETPAARLQSFAAAYHPGRYTEIRLRPLNRLSSGQLIQNLLAIEGLPGRLYEIISSKAEGNPLFIEEVLRMLIDQGVVKQDTVTGRWRAMSQVDTIKIPDTLQGMVLARVDQLDEPVKEVLRVAVVIGRIFHHRVLSEITAAGQDLDEHLGIMEQIELVQMTKAEPEIEYSFKHALIQEAIYESILFEKRRDLHARVAQANESLFAGRLEEFFGVLAYHYARAELWDKAQFYLLRAGDQAVRIAADEEGLSLYNQALAAYERAYGDQWDPLQRAGIERKIGEALLRRGKYQPAVEHIKKALGSLHHTYPTSNGALRKAILKELTSLAGHRKFPALFRKTVVEGTDPVAEEIWILCEVLGWAEGGMYANPIRLLWAVLHMLNFSESRGYIPGMAAGSSGFGTALDYIPLYKLAGNYHRSALELAHQSQNPYLVAQAYQLHGLHFIFIGHWEQALESGRRAQAIFKDLGDLHRMGLAGWIAATALAFQSNFNEALEICQELLEFGTAGEDAQVSAWSLRVSGYVKQRLGRFEESIADLQHCIELSEKLPDYRGWVYAGSELGQCYLRQNKLDKALQVLEATHDVMLKSKVRTGVTVTYFNKWADACLSAAEVESADRRKEWLEKAHEACQINWKKQSRIFPGGLPEAARLLGRYAWLSGKPENARKWWERSLVEAERLGMPHEKALTLFEKGQRLGEPQYQENAALIFSQFELPPFRETPGEPN